MSWTDVCKMKKKTLMGVKEEMKILHTVIGREVNWNGHGLRRNCFLKHVIEGKNIEGK